MYDNLSNRLRGEAEVSDASPYIKDLMRQAADALDHFENLTRTFLNLSSEGSAVAKLYNEAADAIEELIAALTASNTVIANSKPHWIPVTERLPDAGERVLCHCRANIYEVMKMRTDGDWVHNDQLYDSTYMGGFVTHWMPLPKGPKED